MKRIILIITTMIISIQLIPSTDCIGATGILPASIWIENALRGEDYKKSIRIVNGGDDEIKFDLFSSGDIEGWVKFYSDINLTKEIDNVSVPPKTKKEIFVKFSIPYTAANGNYSGTIYAQTNTSTEGGGSPVKIRLPVDVFISVIGTQILNGEVNNIRISSSEVGKPVEIEIDFINTGNVIAMPTIEVNITREGWPIDRVVHSGEKVEVGSGAFIYVRWNTSNREPGSYTAHISVLLDGKLITQQNLSFELFPRGTFTRKGELVYLNYSGKLVKGNLIKILAKFENKGEIETLARFIGEVYIGEKLVDILESEEVLIPVRGDFIFTTYLKLTKNGKYTIKGYILYETNQTDTKTLSFDVKEGEMPSFNLGVVLVILFLIALCLSTIESNGKR